MRDRAVQEFEDATGSAWRPRTTSMVNHKKTTAALIQSRDYISAKRRSETEVLLPPGPKVAFTGGQDCNDHKLIWDVLDKVFAKHPDMVLIHSGNRVGADAIAAAWAKARKVTPIAFTPRKTSATDKSAVFKRNDEMLAAMPIGVIVFPGNGINANLADKAKKLRIPVIDMRGPQNPAA